MRLMTQNAAMEELRYPVRINKYLAWKKYSTRVGADDLVREGRVKINGRLAVLGDKVEESDVVTVEAPTGSYHYYAYHKPRNIVTHSAQEGEKEIADVLGLKNVFPVGRLDKDSHGLILLTDDGRVTEALLNPAHEHEKEYIVHVATELPKGFERMMERGLDIGDHRTKKCEVEIMTPKKFRIILTEGKKRQIRRMSGVLGQSVTELKRTRILNIVLGDLKEGEYRVLEGSELKELLSALGLS